ncbi:hypothetical protein P389DRAFT_593 [Cystobasidium minutum MCA 4210]|uniref:uncharacterized protein n=1 Tax=Cystobasidium minutum MCA 4210 TaxID=1397322 RepID=UPI0034CFCA77|eukprot:jgi/Rhomi1/593/CE592_2796
MKSTRSFSPLYARRYSSLIALLLVLVFSIQLAAGQAQEGNQDIGSIDGSGKDVDSGYLSYVSDMDSAASVREAMETLSWASKGSSWLMETQEAATSEEAQVQATPSEPAAVVATTPTPASAAITSSDTQSSSSSSSKSLAIGLGVGIPLAVLSILSVVALFIYKKRKATKKDFEKRTANLRQMSQTEV